jgi:hypothetical protein
MKNKLSIKNVLFGVVFIFIFGLTFVNTQTFTVPSASAKEEVLCFHCSTDICGNATSGFMCCFRIGGGSWGSCATN